MILSVVIVNWNTRAMLHECLRSTFAGIASLDAEVIVVDNASNDGSQDMVERDFPSVRLIRNDQNRGFAAANNQAFELARGTYVLLLNSDTIVHGNVLADSVGFLEENTTIGAMGCRVLNTDGSMQPSCSRFPTLLNLILLTSGLWKLPWPAFFDRYQMRRWQRTEERDVEVISGCYFLLRARIIDQIGNLDEDFFFFGEETDWCQRLRNAGWRLRFAPVGEITHHGSVSARKLNHKRDLLLSLSLIRYHKKHNGLASAAATWAILLLFNILRAGYWTVRSGVSSEPATLNRRDHFYAIVSHFGQTWPGEDQIKL